MSEDKMAALIQQALVDQGIEDEIVAAGEFNPRGHIGGLFVGGLGGGEVGELVGGRLGEDIGLAAGSLAGMHAADAASGLPENMLLGVSPTTVYGFTARTRHDEPTNLLFNLPRSKLTVNVHRRVNVRILELIDDDSGSKIELEGNRVPLTHSKDVIEALES